MTRGWRNALIAAGAFGCTGLAFVLIVGISDGEAPVTARDLSAISVAERETAEVTGVAGDAGAAAAPERTVQAQSPAVESAADDAARVVLPDLVEVTGVVQPSDDDLVLVGGQGTGSGSVLELDAGPDRWVRSTTAASDVDGDGAVETWWDELSGLVGREVTVLGLVDDGDLDVFAIAGVTLRPPYSEVPPWADDWSRDGLPDEVVAQLETGLSGDEAVIMALALVPGIVIDAEIDVNDGRPYWEVDVRATDGAVYDVEIDAVTGTVVELERR